MLFILLSANSKNYLHLSIVVHYKTVPNNNVLSVNYSFIQIRLLNECHLIGTIKPSPPTITLYAILYFQLFDYFLHFYGNEMPFRCICDLKREKKS